MLEDLGRYMGYAVAFVFVGSLVFLLFAIVRYSIISPILTRGRHRRLHQPSSEDIESLCGFAPPPALLQLYDSAPFIDATEFFLVDRSQAKPRAWFIGAFNPVTKVDIKEQRKVSRVDGIPVASDLDKGTYFVTMEGMVMLSSPNVEDGLAKVADSIEEFARFDVEEDWEESPLEGSNDD